MKAKSSSIRLYSLAFQKAKVKPSAFVLAFDLAFDQLFVILISRFRNSRSENPKSFSPSFFVLSPSFRNTRTIRSGISTLSQFAHQFDLYACMYYSCSKHFTCFSWIKLTILINLIIRVSIIDKIDFVFWI